VDSPCDRINAVALLLAAADPALPALACGDERMCYGELRGAVALAGAAWLDCEVKPGELVLVRARQDIEHAVAFLGAVWAGAVPMPLASPSDHLARHPALRVRFVLDLTRGGHADRWRDHVMTLVEWRMYLAQSRPAGAVALPPESAACWTEARRDGGGARLLAHRFALTASSRPSRTAPESVAVTGALGMLRVLRRGSCAVLGARAAPWPTEPLRGRQELVLP
jgi:hypothetical protein